MAPVCKFLPVAYVPQAGAGAAQSCNFTTGLRVRADLIMSINIFRKLVQRIREEFEDAPDLRMTISEAARFFALDLATCERVLTQLLRDGFLAMGVDQRYGLVAAMC
jgi:hypothetical protein